MASSVDVSVEVLQECLIQEVTLDGQEVYVQPLSMSENLTRLAHKIDFSKDESEEKGKPTSEFDKEEESEQDSVPNQPSLWPWDAIRTKLRAAATELGVLQDVLSIAREKRYMVLDQVANESPEVKNGMLLTAKKKALGGAASILLSGFERLRKSQDVAVQSRRSSADFHSELLRLRQRWRLKKVGTVVIGDLSYKSAGSRHWQNGSFEVSKADNEVKEPAEMSPTPLTGALRVTVLSELEGVAYIQVAIRDLSQMGSSDPLDIATADLTIPQRLAPGAVPADAHWSRKLEAAQNVVFCKEVFSQLGREAVQCRSQIPHVVVGNQILSHLFPGIQLCISLCHYTDRRKPSPDVVRTADHNPVLEHSLHQLLREMHHRNSFQPMPHPVTAILGVSKRRKLAGPLGYTREQFHEVTAQSESMLEQIIKQARHFVIRKRTIDVVDEMIRQVHDPQLTVHVSPVSSTTESIIRVSIAFSGYELAKPLFVLHIACDALKAVCKDGRVVSLSSDEQQLRDFILTQVAQHKLLGIQMVARSLGWSSLSINYHIGVGDLEPTGNAIGIMIASPYHDRILCARIGPVTGMRLYVQRCSAPSRPEVNTDALWNSLGRLSTSVAQPHRVTKWAGLNEPWREICFARIDGRLFVQKFETVLSCLMPDRTSDYNSY